MQEHAYSHKYTGGKKKGEVLVYKSVSNAELMCCLARGQCLNICSLCREWTASLASKCHLYCSSAAALLGCFGMVALLPRIAWETLGNRGPHFPYNSSCLQMLLRHISPYLFFQLLPCFCATPFVQRFPMPVMRQNWSQSSFTEVGQGESKKAVGTGGGTGRQGKVYAASNDRDPVVN